MIGVAFICVAFAKYLPLLFLSMIATTAFSEFSGKTAPAFRELFNKLIPSRIRATALSINSFNMQIGGIFGLIAFGLISENLNLQTGIIVSGILMMLISFLYFRIKSD